MNNSATKRTALWLRQLTVLFVFTSVTCVAELASLHCLADLIAMERHDGCRKGGKGYPCRALRTSKFLYIMNHEPSRWPSGSPDASVCARAIPYGEIDTSPTKTLMMKDSADKHHQKLHQLAFGLRPAEELYDLASDPWQMKNVASNPKYSVDLTRLRNRLAKRLKETNDRSVLLAGHHRQQERWIVQRKCQSLGQANEGAGVAERGAGGACLED